MTGSLAPPPPYGSEQGSILLETGTKDGSSPAQGGRAHSHSISGSSYNVRGASNHLNAQHGRTRSGNFRVLPPTSPGPTRSPTDISLAQLVPNDEHGEASSSAAPASLQQHARNPLNLHLEDATNPPPGYTSPPHSDDDDSRRNSLDSEDEAPLIRVVNRNRGDSSATITPRNQNRPQPQGPVPSYSDALRDGAGSTPREGQQSEDTDEDLDDSEGSENSDTSDSD